MAIFAHSALGSGYQGFAISYAVFFSILTFLWWRTGVHDPEHRSTSLPYALAFLATTILYFVSAFLQPQIAFIIWGIGTVFSIFLPLILTTLNTSVDPEHREMAQRIQPSLVERFGLLTIIVLGEVIVAVVSGASHFKHFDVYHLLMVFLGMFIAIGMWWVYFDFVSHHSPIQKTHTRFAWLYLHLPITMSIALTGAGVLLLLEHAVLTTGMQWLLVGSLGVFLLAVATMVGVIEMDKDHELIHKRGAAVAILAAFGMFALGFMPVDRFSLLLLICLFLMMPILFAFSMWAYGLMHDDYHSH